MEVLKKITAVKARQNLGQIMNEISIKEDDYIVERAGKPLVAIIPIKKYWQLQKDKEEAKDRFFQFVDEIHERNKDTDPEIMEQEIESAVRAVRKKTKTLKHA